MLASSGSVCNAPGEQKACDARNVWQSLLIITEHTTSSQEAHLPGHVTTVPQNLPSMAFLSHFTPHSYLSGVSDYPFGLQYYDNFVWNHLILGNISQYNLIKWNTLKKLRKMKLLLCFPCMKYYLRYSAFLFSFIFIFTLHELCGKLSV